MSRRRHRMLRAFWPQFTDPHAVGNTYHTFSNYPRTFLLATVVLVVASFVPLGIAMLVDYGLNRREVEVEHRLRVVRLASNAKRSIEHILGERLDALTFVGNELEYDMLTRAESLDELLTNLNLGFGGVTDLGVLDATGRQIAYSGPYDLVDRDYGDQDSFLECRRHGAFVSGVFRGHRDEPHIVIAVRCDRRGGATFVLRATVDIQRLVRSLVSFAAAPGDDVFLVDREGVLQTPSRSHGDVLESSGLALPEISKHTQGLETEDASGKPVLLACSEVTTSVAETPFVLVFTRDAQEMVATVADLRTKRTLFFAVSIAGILLAVLFTLTYMFNRLFEADQSKARTILKLEQTSRLASLGRLAAGVAHEINNPLAVINEDAGYIRDLLTLSEVESTDEEVLEHANSVIESVNRCRAITRQLLGFAREGQVQVGRLDVREVIESVLSFHRKEAEHRSIAVELEIEDAARTLATDRGKLQQVLLNLVNNAFQVMTDGGRLHIAARAGADATVSILVSDTGGGIPPDVLDRIFEPFFTTKGEGQGTGLGLAISYGLIRKLGGKMSVDSELGRGSTFTIVLPGRIEAESENETAAGG